MMHVSRVLSKDRGAEKENNRQGKEKSFMGLQAHGLSLPTKSPLSSSEFLQNLLSVPALRGYNQKTRAGRNPWFIVKKILRLSLFAE
jgi:hypothetical protein